MREAQFIKQNTGRWKEFEQTLQSGLATNPDQLADLFVQLTDDLSFSRTNYPDSRTTTYLNNLTAKVHQSIYRNKKENASRFVTFWTHELPRLMYTVQKQLFYAFVVFALSTLIGVVSTIYDEDFPRLILGDAYVDMTIENIKKGDPMAVYKSSTEMEMFLQIPLHNMKVSINVFIVGLLTPVFTALMLLYNGVMLGSFQYFFYKYGVFKTSLLTIWIHGTLEISCIVIAGCAGWVMGNSFLFPGTYTRMESFKTGAKKGVKVCIGILPILLVAGFLESFVTRHTEFPDWLRLLIILSSAAFIGWYFVIYPIILHRKDVLSQN
jgi:uncharacterized membrane protein SpoIIM required for sporulation